MKCGVVKLALLYCAQYNTEGHNDLRSEFSEFSFLLVTEM